jgi:hypothetical protein
VIDEDGDGHPGITVNLSGLSIQGSLYSVQKQTTSVQAIAVAPDRVEGMLTFSSVQTVLASSPASLATLYAMSTTSPDLVACDSTFAMVKVSDSTSSIAVAGDGGLLDASAADGGTIGCDWVRANEALLFPPN